MFAPVQAGVDIDGGRGFQATLPVSLFVRSSRDCTRAIGRAHALRRSRQSGPRGQGRRNPGPLIAVRSDAPDDPGRRPPGRGTSGWDDVSIGPSASSVSRGLATAEGGYCD